MKLAARALGLGWRPETARLVETSTVDHEARGSGQLPLGFVEVIAESLMGAMRGPSGLRLEATLPASLTRLLRAGVPVVPHGVSLGLGSAMPPEKKRLAALARVCKALAAPVVSEHIAFVRAAGSETGHLLPIPRKPAALAILSDNVRRAQDALPVPLVLENIAALFTWPDDAMQDAELLAELVHRTGVGLLLDVANLHANVVNHGLHLPSFLTTLPSAAVVYMHVAGGIERAGFYHDTHAHPASPAVLATLATVLAHVGPRPVLLERDDGFGSRAELVAELDAVARVLATAPASAAEGDTSAPASAAEGDTSAPASAAEGDTSAPGVAPALPHPRPAGCPSVSLSARRALALEQDALVRAVMSGGPVPKGHDPLALERTRTTLLAKQQRLVERCERSHHPRPPLLTRVLRQLLKTTKTTPI